MNFKYKLMRFMYGRNGMDELSKLLIIIAAMLSVINFIWWTIWLQLVVDAILIYAIFRILSKNTTARAKENAKLEKLKSKLLRRYNIAKQRRADRDHVYKKCPNCRAVLRLPRRKGRHTTICPKCKKEFKVYVFKA